MIYTYIPFAPKGKNANLGWCYNNFMEKVDDDDWVVFLDHDATFTTKKWFSQIEEAIEHYPEYGAFTTMMNRVGNNVHIPANVDRNNHDIKYHRKLGAELLEKEGSNVIDFNHGNFSAFLSGVIIITSKKTWKKIGGFKEGFLGVDNCFHVDCLYNNVKVGLIKGLYLYHWYRADGIRPPEYKNNPYFGSEIQNKIRELKQRG